MSNHHNHPSHTHNFFNKHTAFGILLLVIGCFAAGYFVGAHREWSDHGSMRYHNKRMDARYDRMPLDSRLDSARDEHYWQVIN